MSTICTSSEHDEALNNNENKIKYVHYDGTSSFISLTRVFRNSFQYKKNIMTWFSKKW